MRKPTAPPKAATSKARGPVIDLPAVRRGDNHVAHAKAIDPNVTAKPVPVESIAQAGRLTFTVAELARMVDMAPLTIRRQIKAGKLKAANTGGRTEYRISRADIETWWRSRGGGSLFGDLGGDA